MRPTLTPTQQTTALALSKHPRLWRRGMSGLRYAPGLADHLYREIQVTGQETAETARHWGSIPDLSDAATVGCLEAMGRELWPDDRLVCLPPKDGGDIWTIENQSWSPNEWMTVAEAPSRGEVWAALLTKK